MKVIQVVHVTVPPSSCSELTHQSHSILKLPSILSYRDTNSSIVMAFPNFLILGKFSLLTNPSFKNPELSNLSQKEILNCLTKLADKEEEDVRLIAAA